MAITSWWKANNVFDLFNKRSLNKTHLNWNIFITQNSLIFITSSLAWTLLTCKLFISSHHLAHDGFLAGSTDTFRNGLDSEAVEVWLQAPQHVVELVGWFGWTSRGGLSLGLDLLEMEDQGSVSERQSDEQPTEKITEHAIYKDKFCCFWYYHEKPTMFCSMYGNQNNVLLCSNYFLIY